MKDYLRTVERKDRLHPANVAHRGYLDGKVKRASVFQDKLLLDIVCVVFVDIDDDQLFRRAGGYLPAELAADGAAAGDHDGLSAVKCSRFAVGNADRLAEEQILYLYLAYDLLPAARGSVNVVHREIVYLDLASRCRVKVTQPHCLRRRDVGTGDEDLLHRQVLQLFGNLLFAVYRKPENAVSDLLGVDVDEADRHIVRMAACHKFLSKKHPGFARSGNRHSDLVVVTRHTADTAEERLVDEPQKQRDDIKRRRYYKHLTEAVKKTAVDVDKLEHSDCKQSGNDIGKHH
ncbi:unknown [Candidatus Colimorpha enterica]|uniref:Uncharacterized protein n=1 Tax=Candidatus Colimorpha enterica TaxID=3083063 RepID=R6U4G3_9BACT|nr:unknown [Candidatus Colimorpha enterica]